MILQLIDLVIGFDKRKYSISDRVVYLYNQSYITSSVPRTDTS